MPFDPEQVLNAAGGTDPGKGQKSSPGFDPSIVKAAAEGSPNQRNLIAGTIDPNTNFNEFRFQPKTNADNYLLRAQDQGFWESLGKTLGNTLANIPLDVVQGVGYLGTLFELGDERDYNNALTKSIEQLKNPAGEVYLEHPNQTWDVADSAWWLNNLGGLVETAASFAVEGAGIAKLFGTAAKAAAWSTRAAKIGSRIAQGLSASTLTYMEGAMSGATVFENAYNTNYMKMIGQGMDSVEADQQARHIASQAAAATVQLHTIMNLGLNMTALAPIFRDTDQAIVQWWRQNGALQKGEDIASWGARISAAAPEGTALKKLLGMGMQGPGRLGLEAFQEGLEEVNTQYAEHVGKAIGEQRDTKDIGRQLTDLDRYFSEVLNQEGGLNMALGALGGLAQTAILDHIPVHQVVKYGPDGKPVMVDGKPQTERISSHTMNNRMNRQYFDNIKDVLTKDMEWFSAKNKEMQDALKNNDLATLARTRADLLSVHNLKAISMGLGDVWKNQYHDIAQLDNSRGIGEQLQPQLEALTQQMQDAFNAGDTNTANQLNIERMKVLDQQQSLMDTTEAMQKGFSQSKNDNTYKEKAQQAIQNLDYLTDLYNEMQSRFSLPEMQEAGLSEHMFYRQANLFLHKQQLDNMEQDLMKLRSKIDSMLLSQQDDVLIQQAKQYVTDKEVWDTTVKKLNNDIKRLNDAITANDNTVFLQLLDKYKIPVTKGAGKQLIDTLNKRKSELEKRSEFSNKELNDTLDVWKQTNPDGDVKELMKRVSEKPVLEDIYKQNKIHYQQGMTEYETARTQFANDSTEKSIQRFLKENKPQSQKAEIDKQHIDAYNSQLDREIAATMDAKQKQTQVEKLNARIGQLQQNIIEANVRIADRQKGIIAAKGFKNITSRLALRGEIGSIERDIKEYEYELNHLIQRRGAMNSQANQAAAQAQNVARSPAPVIQPVTKVEPASTPAENTTTTPEFNEELPAFDFSTEIVQFTTLEAGHPVFDNMVGGNEAGNILRQFIQLRKVGSTEFLVNGVRSMIQKTNLPMPSDEDFSNFITPYVNALKEQYLSQKPTAIEDYEGLKGFLKPVVLQMLDILEGEFREHGFSYDRALQVLNKQVKEGNLEKNLVGDIANRLKAYIESTQAQDTTVKAETIEAPQVVAVEGKDMNEEPGTYIAPTTDSEPTVFSNAALDLEIVQQDQKRFVGASNIEAVKANFNTHPYKEFDNGSTIRIVSDYTQLDPKLNTDVLLPGVINQGDEVVFVVDENWAGEINYDTEMVQDDYGDQVRRADMFQNYLDATGKIDTLSTARHPRGGHANVPVKIVHKKTGQTIGYLPRAEWILAKYPDTQNFRNVVDEYQDEDVTVTDNVARQYGRIIKLREAIIRAWNTDRSLQLTSTISKRGTGHIMINREVNPNTGRTKLLNRSAKNMLPDPSLEIAIIKQGTPYVSNGIASQKKINKLPSFMTDATSMPVAMLPSPDGSYVPTPLYTHRLGDNPGTLNTVIGAIEMYLRAAAGISTQNDLKNLQRISTEIGFDLMIPGGLRDFIQQYFTYTQKFGEKDTVITPSEVQGNATQQFMLDIPDLQPGEKVAFIKVGTSFSGEKPIYAQLINGQLHPDFEQALREGLSDRFKNVVFPGKNLRGINSPGEFKAPIIKKDGTLQVNTYQDYNEFVKASSVTFAYGLNKVSNQYVYMANPVIQLDYIQALQGAPPVPSTTLKESPQQPSATTDQDIKEYDDLADLFGNGMLSPGPSSVTPLATPSEGEQVSLELLQNLRNITPEAHRNSKTPEQVLRELLERGVTVLADGHNPFYIC